MNIKLTFSVVVLLTSSVPSAYADSALFRSPLVPSTVALDARGTVSGSLNERVSTLTVSASRLLPLQPCQVLVDGQIKATTTTTRAGTLLLRLRSPSARGFLPLDFEPRGTTIELLLNGAPVLSTALAGPGAPPRSSSSEVTDLRRRQPTSRSTATASHVLSTNGTSTFSINATRLSSSPVTLRVNGKPLGSPLTPSRSGTVSVRYRSPNAGSGFLPLTFDPRGDTLELVQDSQTILAGEMRARARGINHAPPSALLLYLPATVNPAPGEAYARYLVDERARRTFEVDLEYVPVGSYDLLVNDVLRGTIRVRDGDEYPEGEIEFSSHDDDDLPLDFDPLGAILSIRNSSGETLFSGLFDPSVLGTRPLPEPASEFTERLTSTGVDRDAYGEARYEVDEDGDHYFEIEIEDVAPGSYSLLVGGIDRATLRATLQGDTVEGEVEFRSPGERGKVTMNFDPRGQLIEIVNAANETLFRHLFGSGNAPSAPPVTPVYLREALLADPSAIGSVVAYFETDVDGDTELELEARGLPVGSYQVTVGGVLRGTLNVTSRGSRTFGEIEFDTDPDGHEILLDFPVLGQEITVSTPAGVLFSRTLSLP